MMITAKDNDVGYKTFIALAATFYVDVYTAVANCCQATVFCKHVFYKADDLGLLIYTQHNQNMRNDNE